MEKHTQKIKWILCKDGANWGYWHNTVSSFVGLGCFTRSIYWRIACFDSSFFCWQRPNCIWYQSECVRPWWQETFPLQAAWNCNPDSRNSSTHLFCLQTHFTLNARRFPLCVCLYSAVVVAKAQTELIRKCAGLRPTRADQSEQNGLFWMGGLKETSTVVERSVRGWLEAL